LIHVRTSIAAPAAPLQDFGGGDSENHFASASNTGLVIIARLPAKTPIRDQQPVTLAVGANGLHIFDPGTGRSLAFGR
jgi:hypothetical protein